MATSIKPTNSDRTRILEGPPPSSMIPADWDSSHRIWEHFVMSYVESDASLGCCINAVSGTGEG
jgi:hypothetical protein